MSKEQALTSLAAVHEYALNDLGPNHPMTRDMAVWLQRHFGAQGTAAINANARAKTTASKQAAAPAKNGGNPALKVFRHPALKQEAQSAAATPGEPKAEPRKPLRKAEIKPRPVERQPEAESPGTENPALVAAADTGLTAIPATDFPAIKDMKPHGIVLKYGGAAIAETLRQAFEVDDADIPPKANQKAAMLKAKIQA